MADPGNDESGLVVALEVARTPVDRRLLDDRAAPRPGQRCRCEWRIEGAGGRVGAGEEVHRPLAQPTPLAALLAGAQRQGVMARDEVLVGDVEEDRYRRAATASPPLRDQATGRGIDEARSHPAERPILASADKNGQLLGEVLGIGARSLRVDAKPALVRCALRVAPLGAATRNALHRRGRGRGAGRFTEGAGQRSREKGEHTRTRD